MTIFVIFRVGDPSRLKDKLQDVFPNDYFEIQEDEFLVSASGTTKEVSDRLGITSSPSPTTSAIVFSMASYFGRASTEIWDWIRTKAEKTIG
jgi:hypothetical protein